MTQYDLYRNLACAIYALALDAVQSRDIERVALVESIARATFTPLRDELGGDSPIYGILEYLAAPMVIEDDWWSFSLDNMIQLKEIYPEILV